MNEASQNEATKSQRSRSARFYISLTIAMVLVLAGIFLLSPMPDYDEEPEILMLTPDSFVIAGQLQPLPSPSPTPTPEFTDAAPTLPPASDEAEQVDLNVQQGPIRHVIEEQDTLWYILQLYGHRFDLSNQALLDLFVEINDNVFNPDILPAPGNTVLVPVPTSVPDISAEENTDAPQATLPPDITPSETPNPNGPVQYTIQVGDTLQGIVRSQGYTYSQALVDEIVRLNTNLSNPEILPAGSSILIPAMTGTPVPEGIELTLTADANLGVVRLGGDITVAQNTQFDCHTVQPGETIVGIAAEYNTTLEVLSQLNRELDWSGCNFTLYSGGENCNPIIIEDQCINVPLPTPVPSATPTPSGNETPTPTPTFIAPKGIYPPDGAIAPAIPISLQWVSVGILQPGEEYIIELHDLTTTELKLYNTRNTSLQLPESIIPTDGQQHEIQWRVTVMKPNSAGQYAPVGGIGKWRTYMWESQ